MLAFPQPSKGLQNVTYFLVFLFYRLSKNDDTGYQISQQATWHVCESLNKKSYIRSVFDI
jgi:hypothetical protein